MADENPRCEICEGQTVTMGRVNGKRYVRCRDCGWDMIEGESQYSGFDEWEEAPVDDEA